MLPSCHFLRRLGATLAVSLLLMAHARGAFANEASRTPRQPSYQLRLEVDVPVLVIAAVFSGGRVFRGGLTPAYCAPMKGSPVEAATRCDPETVNAFDRPFAGRYQPSWKKWSDTGVVAIGAAAAVGILVDEGPRSGVNDLVVVAEAALLANATSGISTALTGRPRPFMYGTEAPLSTRESGDGALSYFSAHTATAFAIASATFMTVRRQHPNSIWPWVVLTSGMVASGFVGATRILGGYHFPTDVLAGAAVGTSIGIAVPYLHTAPSGPELVPLTTIGGGGLALRGEFP